MFRLAAARFSGRAREAENNQRSEFDEKYGTETSGRIDQIDLDTHGFATWWHGVAYQPSGAGLIKQLVGATGIDPSAYTFLDLGSGKGRMVLEAAEAGFMKSIGVEFSESLVNIAKRNAASFHERSASGPVEFHHADASNFDLPTGPLVVFLYNPFGAPVMLQVARRAADRQRAGHGPLSIWYHNPVCGDSWDEAGFVKSAELPDLDALIWTA